MKVSVEKLKNKKVIAIGLAAVLIAAIVLIVLYAFSHEEDPRASVKPADSVNICLAPPTDGTTPENYDALNNVGFLIGRLSGRDAYHTENEGTVIATVGFIKANQSVYGWKDYCDGIMLASSVSISSNPFAPSKAIQKFFGADTMVVRSAVNDKKDWEKGDVEWSTGEPSEILTLQQGQEKYGLPATEFSDYVINEETFLSASELSQEGGEYVLSVSLEPNESTYYYKKQMVTMGNLDESPVFSSVEMTFRFAADWTVNKVEIQEKYTSKKGVDAKCEGSSEINFYYEKEKIDVSAYDTYFSKYADAAATGGVQEDLTAIDYLSKGFASVLNGESVLQVNGTLAGEPVSGAVLLKMQEMQLSALQVRLGDLNVAYSGSAVIVQYKDFIGKIALSDLTGLLPSDGESSLPDMDSLAGAFEGIEPVKDGDRVTIVCDLALMGVEIPLRFSFTESENTVVWNDLSAELSLFGIEIAITACPAAEQVSFDAIDETKAVDLLPYILSLQELLGSESYGWELAAPEIGLTINGKLAADVADPFSVYGEALIQYGTIRLPVAFALKGETVYLEIFQARIKSTLSELQSDLVEIGLTLPELSGTEVELSKIIAFVVGIDFDDVLSGLSLTEKEFALKINGDALLESLKPLLNINGIALGELEAKYSKDDQTFAFSAAGAQMRFGGSEDTVKDITGEGDFLSAGDFLQFVAPVRDLIEKKDIGFKLNGTMQAAGETLTLALSGEIRFFDGLWLYLGGNVNGVRFQVLYDGKEVALEIGGYGLRLKETDLDSLSDTLTKIINETQAKGDNKAALLLFSSEGLDLAGFIESLRLAAAEGGALKISMDLSKLLQSEKTGEVTIELSTDGTAITVRTDKLSVSGAELVGIDVTVFAADGSFVPDFSDAKECGTIFELAMNLYETIASTQYIGLSMGYSSAEMSVALEGKIQLEKNEQISDTSDAIVPNVILNLDFAAQIDTFAEDGSAQDSHYIHLIVLRDQLYVSYSVLAMDADTALRVTMPIKELFAVGETVLPILSPLLWPQGNPYYYEFVTAILSGGYDTINSSIFGVMDTDAWLNLVLGIFREYASAESDVKTVLPEGAAQFGIGEDGNYCLKIGDLSVAGGGSIRLSLTALKETNAIQPDLTKTYTDISSVGTLLQDVLSAYKYSKDGGYLLSGTLTMSVASIKDVPIDIEIRVGYDEAEELCVYIRTFVKKTSMVFVPIISADTVTEIVIKGGSVYMLRNVLQGDPVSSQDLYYKYTGSGWFGTVNYYDVTSLLTYRASGTSEYRVMTLDSFLGGDTAALMEHLYFILNLSSSAKDIIDYAIKNTGGGSDGQKYDAGQMVGSYGFSENVYSVSLNMGAIVSSDALGALTLNIARTPSADGEAYDLTRLSGDLQIVSAIKINFDISQPSPGSDAMTDEYCDKILDLLAQDGVTVPDKEYSSGTASGVYEWQLVQTVQREKKASGDNWNKGEGSLV